MFVTSKQYSGDLGGLSGADTKCNGAAASNPKLAARRFKAWLSHSSQDAKLRVDRGDGRILVRPDDVTVARDLSALVARDLEAAVNVSEAGATVAPGTEVWTGTGGSGAFVGGGCSAWKQSFDTENGTYGVVAGTASTWTNAGSASCDGLRALYCMEE